MIQKDWVLKFDTELFQLRNLGTDEIEGTLFSVVFDKLHWHLINTNWKQFVKSITQ